MSSWSRMSSARFQRSGTNLVGPGSYELPTTLDDHGTTIIRSGSERFLELPLELLEENGIHMHEDSIERRPKSQGPSRKSLAWRPLYGKENSPVLNSARSNKSEGEVPLKRAVDANRGDLAIAKKAAANAHAQLRAKDEQLAALQKQVDELTAANRDLQRRAADLESDRRLRSQALHHSEQAIAGLQRSLEQSRSQVEAQKLHIEQMRRDSAAGITSEELSLKERGLEEAQRELAEAKREAERRTRRLEARESALKEAVAEAVSSQRSRIDDIEQRVAAGADSAAAQMSALFEQQERTVGKLLEVKERRYRAESIARSLKREQGSMVSRLVVQQAYVGAALRLWHYSEDKFESQRPLQAQVGTPERAAAVAAREELTELTMRATAAEIEAEDCRHRAEAAEAKAKACAVLVKEKQALEQSEAALQAKTFACARLVKEKEELARDADALRLEVERLRAAESTLQANLEQSMEREATLAGHANHRQKIRVTMNLKEENVALQAELKKERERAFLLEKQLERCHEGTDAEVASLM